MSIHKTIQEYGKIFRQRDFVDSIDGFSEIYLEDEAFDNFWSFVVENQGEGSDVEKAFSVHKSKGRDFIRTKNFVGVIETKSGTSIEILPKIYKVTDVQTTRKVFLKMLRYLQDAPFIRIQEAHVKATQFPILEVFITAFLEDLSVLVKKGIRQDYGNVEENQRFVKGKILFTQNLRENLVHPERFYIRYEQFHANNAHNRLIKSVLVHLLHTSTNFQNQNRLRQFLFIFDMVLVSQNLAKDFHLAQNHHRLFRHYYPLIEWAKVFLLNLSFVNFRGRYINRAILFPMERIFEDYIAQVFRKNLKDYEVLLQHKSWHLIEEHQGKPKFRLRPDIVIQNENECHIIDTKWKLLDTRSPDKNYQIAQSDLYQLYAYGKKYTRSNCIPKLYLIYPKQAHFVAQLPPFLYENELELFVVPFDLVGEEESVVRGVIES